MQILLIYSKINGSSLINPFLVESVCFKTILKNKNISTMNDKNIYNVLFTNKKKSKATFALGMSQLKFNISDGVVSNVLY